MQKLLTNSLFLLLLIFSTVVRSHNIPGRTTFEWDQERDLQVITKMLESKRPTLIGPVAKGEGGFHMGPGYYYLLLPVYLLLDGNILSGAYLSIFLDLLSVAGLFFLTKKITGSLLASFSAATLWGLSIYAANSSLVPWNVSLAPPYVTIALYLLFLYRKIKTKKILLALIFWWSAAIHVHPILLFVIPSFIPISSTLKLLKSTKVSLIQITLSLLLPLSPLILFDFRHSFLNTKLLIDFLFERNGVFKLVPVVSALFSKLSSLISMIYLGKEYVVAGAVLLILTYLLFWRSKDWLSKGIFVLTFLISFYLTLVGDSDFANYYLSPIAIPLVLKLAQVVSLSRPRLLGYLFLSVILFNNILNYDFTDGPYSLRRKEEVISAVSSWRSPVDLRLELPVGRRGGFEYYIKKSTLNVERNAASVALIVESSQMEIIAPEKARSIVIEKVIGGYKFIGFGN